MARVIDLKSTRVWVLTTAPADATLASILVTEVTAGKDITPFVLPSSKLPAYDADKTTSEYSIAQGDEIVAPTGSTYSGSLDLFRDFTAGVPSTADVLTIFQGNYEQVYFVIREGLPYTTAATAAQKVAVYQVTAGKPQRMRGSNSGFLKVKVPLMTLGNANENAVLA